MKKKCGHIYHKVCYLKYKKPVRHGKKRIVGQPEENDHPNENEEPDEIDELQFQLYFKTCVIDRDLEILKIKLKQSIEMRERLVKKKGIEFHKTFPFYFLEPSLVS